MSRRVRPSAPDQQKARTRLPTWKRPTPMRTLGVATTASTLAALPVWVTGALAVFIGQEMGFGETQHGAAVSIYFATAAVTSFFAGVVTERVGARYAATCAIGMTTLALVGIGVVASSWWHIVSFMMVAGAGSAVMQPATNLALARAIPSERRAVSFGLKQASIPFATLLAGTAVPVFAVTHGWRSAFLAATGVVLLFSLTLPVLPSGGPPSSSTTITWRNVRPSLIVVTCGAGFGVAAATAMGTFAVLGGIERGLSASMAGVILTVAGLSAGVSRIVVGWLADRRGTNHLPRVAGMMALGATAGVTIAWSSTATPFALAMIVLYAAGWGWNGLFIFSAITQYPSIPAVVTGVTQIGVRAGGVVGPLGFGVLAHHGSEMVAWLALGASQLVGAILVIAGRYMLLRERKAESLAAPKAPHTDHRSTKEITNPKLVDSVE